MSQRRLQAVVEADRLVQGDPGFVAAAALGQDHRQVLQGGRQLHGGPGRPVVRGGVPERSRVRAEQSTAP